MSEEKKTKKGVALDSAQEPETTTNTTVSGFDLSRIRLGQDFAEQVNVSRRPTRIPVRRPHKTQWVRVREGEDWRLDAMLLELAGEREPYVVARDIAREFETLAQPATLFTGITRQGVLFVWPAKLPGADGRTNSWHESGLEAAREAMKGWVRVCAVMDAGGYDLISPAGKFPEPVWPDISFAEILEIAFRSRMINDLDHPVLLQLRGQE